MCQDFLSADTISSLNIFFIFIFIFFFFWGGGGGG